MGTATMGTGCEMVYCESALTGGGNRVSAVKLNSLLTTEKGLSYLSQHARR